MMQDTSLAAYHDIQPSLTQRERAVWEHLGRYCAVTAYELFDYMRGCGTALDLNDVRPRLTELYHKGCVERLGKRPCTITGRTAYTWRAVPGQPPQPRTVHVAPVTAKAREARLF